MTINANIRNQFRYGLPYPIAINYKRIGACPENNATRLMYILKTGEMAVRMLAVIALGEARRAFAGSQIPEGDLRRNFSERFARPTFGTWIWLLRESLITLNGSSTTPLVPEFRDLTSATEGEKRDIFSLLDGMLVLRNRFIHDGVSADEWLQPREIRQSCETALAQLEEILTRVLFLAEYPICFVSPITVEKKRNTNPRYTKDTLVISGCADQFDVERKVSDRICESGEMLLMDRKSGQYLNLDPLILYSNEGVEEKTGADGSSVTVQTGIYDVFLYNGRNGNHYTYLACNKGGKLTTRDAQARDYLERGFGEIKALFGVGSGAES